MHVAKTFPLAQHGPKSPTDSEWTEVGLATLGFHLKLFPPCFSPATQRHDVPSTLPRRITNLPATPLWRPELCQTLCQAPQTKGLMGDEGERLQWLFPTPHPVSPHNRTCMGSSHCSPAPHFGRA